MYTMAASPRCVAFQSTFHTTPRLATAPSPRSASLFSGSTAESFLPWYPPPPQQQFGTKISSLAVAGHATPSRITTPFRPAFTREAHTPLATAFGPDKIFDDAIRLPRGDVGAQQFGRSGRKLDGNEWTASPRARGATEIGTTPRSTVRAWRSPGCDHIQYQLDHRRK